MSRLVSLVLATCIVAACSARVDYEQPRSTSSPDAIDINAATADELEKLPHIGRKTAEAIVEYRQVNGPFRRVEHVMLIRGISESRFVEIRHLLRVE